LQIKENSSPTSEIEGKKCSFHVSFTVFFLSRIPKTSCIRRKTPPAARKTRSFRQGFAVFPPIDLHRKAEQMNQMKYNGMRKIRDAISIALRFFSSWRANPENPENAPLPEQRHPPFSVRRLQESREQKRTPVDFATQFSFFSKIKDKLVCLDIPNGPTFSIVKAVRMPNDPTCGPNSSAKSSLPSGWAAPNPK
jgi:hypothetical protein